MAPHRAVLRAVECRLMAQVPLISPVLDIGCGDGHFASIAYEKLPIDVGVDVMARDLAEAVRQWCRSSVCRQQLQHRHQQLRDRAHT